MSISYVKSISDQLLKKSGKNITINKIKGVLQDHIGDGYNDNKLYKLIYTLKNRGTLIELKQGFYMIGSGKQHIDADISDDDYWYILCKYVKSRVGKEWIITGTKALELSLQNRDVSDHIYILTDGIVGNEKLYHGKTIGFRSYNQSKQSIYKSFAKYATKMIIADKKINVACMELALLDTLNEGDLSEIGYQVEIIKKILSKSRKQYDLDKIAQIVKIGKHHTAINKLYKIAGKVDSSLAKQIFDIIKRYSYNIKI